MQGVGISQTNAGGIQGGSATGGYYWIFFINLFIFNLHFSFFISIFDINI